MPPPPPPFHRCTLLRRTQPLKPSRPRLVTLQRPSAPPHPAVPYTYTSFIPPSFVPCTSRRRCIAASPVLASRPDPCSPTLHRTASPPSPLPSSVPLHSEDGYAPGATARFLALRIKLNGGEECAAAGRGRMRSSSCVRRPGAGADARAAPVLPAPLPPPWIGYVGLPLPRARCRSPLRTARVRSASPMLEFTHSRMLRSWYPVRSADELREDAGEDGPRTARCGDDDQERAIDGAVGGVRLRVYRDYFTCSLLPFPAHWRGTTPDRPPPSSLLPAAAPALRIPQSRIWPCAQDAGEGDGGCTTPP
ncbi:hypothetical protein DFH06DRAFT_1382271 [Mycena polygramma]|nr:hypothetical protein DFH06DRAFT_1382271 [Mycena polygramma]